MAVLDRIRLTGLLVLHGPGFPMRKAGAFKFSVRFTPRPAGGQFRHRSAAVAGAPYIPAVRLGASANRLATKSSMKSGWTGLARISNMLPRLAASSINAGVPA